MKRTIERLLLSTLLVGAVSSAAQASPPVILGVNPSHGSTMGGVPLTIDGSSFGGTEGSVTVGGNACASLIWTDNRILCSIPEGTGASNSVDVLTAGGESGTGSSFAYDPPSISGITPSSGTEAGGTVLTLTGSNFGPASADARRGVVMGSTLSNCVLVFGGNDHGVVHCTTPPGTGSGVDVVLTVDGQSSNAVTFDYIPSTPSISSVTPSSGSTVGGFPITIDGELFASSGNSVTVGGRACPVTNESTTEILCTLPEGLGADQEVLVTADGQIAGNAYFDYDLPSIGSITPDHGPTEGNVPITIQGSNFGPASADSMRSVVVGLVDCPLLASVNDHDEIQCMLPPGQGTGLGVQVTVAGQSSNVQTIDYDAPTIDSVSPARASALGGDRITIHGHNFGSDATLRIRGGAYDTVSQTHDEIVWDAPPDAGGVAPLLVEVSGQSAATSIEFVVPHCGDAYQDVQVGEVCDDGGNTSGDGCSADCRTEHNPTKDEISCILAMNKAAAGIFKAQAKDDLLCATKGDGTACVGASVSDGVGKARDKASAASDKKCPTAPVFGAAPLSDVQDANVAEELAFLHDLFGADPDAALAESAMAPNRARCQNDVLKAEQKFMAARLKAFGKCKKAGFKEGTILTDSQLAACLATADADPALAKPAAAQFSTLIDSCLNLSEDMALAFPGRCSVSPSVGECLESLARCHTCLALKKTDTLWIDCDVDDDGVTNATCGDD